MTKKEEEIKDMEWCLLKNDYVIHHHKSMKVILEYAEIYGQMWGEKDLVISQYFSPKILHFLTPFTSSRK